MLQVFCITNHNGIKILREGSIVIVIEPHLLKRLVYPFEFIVLKFLFSLFRDGLAIIYVQITFGVSLIISIDNEVQTCVRKLIGAISKRFYVITSNVVLNRKDRSRLKMLLDSKLSSVKFY